MSVKLKLATRKSRSLKGMPGPFMSQGRMARLGFRDVVLTWNLWRFEGFSAVR